MSAEVPVPADTSAPLPAHKAHRTDALKWRSGA